MSDKRIVYKEHKRLGVKFGSNNSGGKGTGRNHYNANSSNTNTIIQLRKHNNNLKRKIKALKQSNPSDDTKKEEVDNAGDEFRGKKSKKKKQENS